MVGLIAVIGFACSLFSISTWKIIATCVLRVLHQCFHCYDVDGCHCLEWILLPAVLGDDDTGFIFPDYLRNDKRKPSGRFPVHARGIATHAIMIVFFILFLNSGSFDFHPSASWAAGRTESLVFLLAFAGFGRR
jgi:hypothetical protein